MIGQVRRSHLPHPTAIAYPQTAIAPSISPKAIPAERFAIAPHIPKSELTSQCLRYRPSHPQNSDIYAYGTLRER